MKVMRLSLTFLILLIFCSCSREIRLPADRFSADQLRTDFRQAEAGLRNYAQYFTDSDELQLTRSGQFALITDSMSMLEFYRVLAPVLADVRCGHARLSLPESVEEWLSDNGKYLPLQIKILRDSLFVLHSYIDTPSVKSGSVLLAINGEPASDIVEHLISCLPSDGNNETYKYWAMNEDFA
ncbi:MAG: hypothetical protein GY869_23595, partial [Planctomycetes bacterium]|nr:hypothetical protein [Planctomycetota bacterium]